MLLKSSRAIYSDDRILRLLYLTLFKPYGVIKSSILLFIIPITLCILAGSFDGTLKSTPELVGVIKDYSLYTLWIIVLGLAALFYKFSFALEDFFTVGIKRVINTKKINAELIQSFDEKISSVLHPTGWLKLLKFILIGLFLAFWLLNLFNSFDPVANYGKDIWHSANHIYGFLILKSFNLLYTTILLSILFYKYISSLFVVSWLFKKLSNIDGFIIRPLSPDNCSGLKVLSNLSLYYVYMNLPFFLFFLSVFLRGTNLLFTQQVILILLLLNLVLSFFLPLGAVHGAMKRAKNKELEEIAVNFNEINESVKGLLTDKDYHDELAMKLDILSKMDILYSNVKKTPVWPFNLENFGRVMIAASIPILIFLIDLMTNTDSILYNIEKLNIFRFFVE